MYQMPSRKKQLITRTAIYAVMTALVLIAVAALVFLMLGYRFNRSTSTIQQGGLVQFNSRPQDTRVTIGKAQLASATPTKVTINPGTYTVKMEKANYQPWQKTANVKAGSVLWLNYAKLVPNTVTTTAIKTFDSVAQVKASPNARYFAYVAATDKPVISFAQLGDSVQLKDIVIPASELPEGAAQYTLHDWASDSDRLLVSAKVDNVIEWIVIDRRDAAKSINISKRYDRSITEPLFDTRSSENLFVRTATSDVRFLETGRGSISGVLAEKVQSMSLYKSDALVYVRTLAEGGQAIGYLSLGEDKGRDIRSYQQTEPLNVSIDDYYGDPYMAVTSGTTLTVEKIVNSLPRSTSSSPISMSKVTSQALPSTALRVAIKSSGRFFIAQYGNGFGNYDIELGRFTTTDATALGAEKLRWLDKHHYYISDGTTLRFAEFDGENQRDIAPVSTTFDILQSNDGKFIYSFTKNKAGKIDLQRSRMILE